MFFFVPAAGGTLSAGTLTDLQDLKALLLKAKAENEQLQAERDQVGMASLFRCGQ